MSRGGSRPGAGRPVGSTKKSKDKEIAIKSAETEIKSGDISPLEFLLGVMRDPGEEVRFRIQCASIAAPYVHAKKGENGKKDEQGEKAKAAGAGKFGQATAPRLVSAGGKKV